MIRALATALIVVCATSASVHAQTTTTTTTATTGIVADRFTPAVGPGSFVGVEGAPTTAAGAVSWVVALDLGRDPIVLRSATGLETHPVHDALVLDVGLEFGIWKRLAVAIGMPVVLFQDGDRLRGLGVDETHLATSAAGDVRMRIKALLAGDPNADGVHASVQLQLTAPASGQHDFAATAGATIEPRLVADWRIGRFALGATLGVRFIGDRTLFATKFGDELTWGAAASLRLVTHPRAGLAAVLEGEGAVGEFAYTRPAELRGALRVTSRWVSFDAGAGGGLDADIGAPAWRVFVVARGGLGLAR
ncbi:MAG TPA: hypothetical protein VIA18_32675 [Polyangia bacterium]|jgi:hypothetical protein|nr:hypothetical protein [Polyangia bacterium]